MAKQKNKWTIAGSVMTCTMPEGTIFTADLIEICPKFLEMSEVEQYVFYYGAKQRCSDETAPPKDVTYNEQEKLSLMEGVWDMLKAGDTAKARKVGARKPSWDKAVEQAKKNEKLTPAQKKTLENAKEIMAKLGM